MAHQRPINSKDAPAPVGGYAQAVEVVDSTRCLYISGQIPVTREGNVPESFSEQAKLVWTNIEAQLRAADMSLQHIVKLTTFLSDRKYAPENRQARQAVLGSHSPAATVIITGIFDESWLLEIEAIAQA